MDIRDFLEYEPDTGAFRWKVARRAKAKAGSIAGTVTDKGYIHIYFNKACLKAHRLVFLFVEGEHLSPNVEIDHINGDRTDNSLANLRKCTRQQNQQNLPMFKNNKTGFLGVIFDRGVYRAKLSSHGRIFRAGPFATPEEAAQAYLDMKMKHHQFNPIPRKDQ